MGFLDHLEELRKRVITCLIVVLVFSIGAYFFSERIIDFIARPVERLYFLDPTEAFAVRIKISIIMGIIVGIPIIFYNFWQFIVPGLFEKEIKLVVPVVLFSTIFFLIGASFCFFLVLPMGIKFLLGFGTEKLFPMIKIGSYISFVTYMTLAFGLVFELPIISFFLGKVGIVTPQILAKGRRYAVVGILILAAALTPSPDVFSQMMLAGPLYFLYEVSILVVKSVQKKKKA